MAAHLTEREIRALLPEAAGLPITITYLPNIRAMNIVIDGLLGAGVAYHARFDPQAKGLGEWLRSRLVDVPESLLGEAAR
jgi:NAD(P)H-hydrate repair Nnr-like enzyme with NAD(P)H-hydrate epimerase domain